MDSEDVAPYDLRRSGLTNLASEWIGIPWFIVSQILGHAGDMRGGAVVSGTYDRNDYLKEKRRALDAWRSKLFGVVDVTNSTSNVIAMPAKN